MVTNPYTQKPVTHLYYSLFYGLGTTPSCSTSNDNACISWSDIRAWDTFIRLLAPLVNVVMPISGSTIQAAWIVAQVFLPIASFSCLLAALCLSYSVRETSSLALSRANEIILQSISYICITLAWVFGLIALTSFINSPVMKSSAWKKYYNGI